MPALTNFAVLCTAPSFDNAPGAHDRWISDLNVNNIIYYNKQNFVITFQADNEPPFKTSTAASAI
jgi:hypothetical protein